MILIETFMVYIKKFRNLVVLYLDLNKFPNQPSKSRPITTADIILSCRYCGHFGRFRGRLRSFAVVPSDGPLLNRADFNKVFGPVLISLFQSQDQRQELFHKLLGIYIGAKLAIIGVTP